MLLQSPSFAESREERDWDRESEPLVVQAKKGDQEKREGDHIVSQSWIWDFTCLSLSPFCFTSPSKDPLSLLNFSHLLTNYSILCPHSPQRQES